MFPSGSAQKGISPQNALPPPASVTGWKVCRKAARQRMRLVGMTEDHIRLVESTAQSMHD